MEVEVTEVLQGRFEEDIVATLDAKKADIALRVLQDNVGEIELRFFVGRRRPRSAGGCAGSGLDLESLVCAHATTPIVAATRTGVGTAGLDRLGRFRGSAGVRCVAGARWFACGTGGSPESFRRLLRGIGRSLFHVRLCRFAGGRTDDGFECKLPKQEQGQEPQQEKYEEAQQPTRKNRTLDEHAVGLEGAHALGRRLRQDLERDGLLRAAKEPLHWPDVDAGEVCLARIDQQTRRVKFEREKTVGV